MSSLIDTTFQKRDMAVVLSPKQGIVGITSTVVKDCPTDTSAEPLRSIVSAPGPPGSASENKRSSGEMGINNERSDRKGSTGSFFDSEGSISKDGHADEHNKGDHPEADPQVSEKSISPAAAAGSNLGRRGDPRMHKAVASRLANPSMTLLEALIEGGFDFPDDMDASVVGKSDRDIFDCEGVQLCQRKNQLSRRLRLIRKREHPGTKDSESPPATLSPTTQDPNVAALGSRSSITEMMLLHQQQQHQRQQQSQDINAYRHLIPGLHSSPARPLHPFPGLLQQNRAYEDVTSMHSSFLDNQTDVAAGQGKRLRHNDDIMLSKAKKLAASAQSRMILSATNQQHQNALQQARNQSALLTNASQDLSSISSANQNIQFGTRATVMHPHTRNGMTNIALQSPAARINLNGDVNMTNLYLQQFAGAPSVGNQQILSQDMMLNHDGQRISGVSARNAMGMMGKSADIRMMSNNEGFNGSGAGAMGSGDIEAKLNLATEIYGRDHDAFSRSCLKQAGLFDTEICNSGVRSAFEKKVKAKRINDSSNFYR